MMNRQQLKNYINNFNEYSDRNSESYIKARYVLNSQRNLANQSDTEMSGLIELAKSKNLIN